MQIDVRDHESIDQAIATGLKSARSRRLEASGGPSEDRPVSEETGARRRNPVVRLVGRAGRGIVRKPLGRFRSYLNAPIESRLDDVTMSAVDRRRSEIAALSLEAQIVNLREEIAALRAEVASASLERPKPARDA